MRITDLVNQRVSHKNFGSGIICNTDKNMYLSVKFEGKKEPCKFAYPQCFYGYLTFEDNQMQNEINSVLEDWKRENGIEEKENLRQKYQKTLCGIEKRRNAAAEKKARAMQRATEHRGMYHLKKNPEVSE